MTESNDDKLAAAAKRLATEISPERDLWPGIAEAIHTPRRSRWTPMFAQAAAIVLLIGASSAVTYVAVKGQQGRRYTGDAEPCFRTDLVRQSLQHGARFSGRAQRTCRTT